MPPKRSTYNTPIRTELTISRVAPDNPTTDLLSDIIAEAVANTYITEIKDDADKGNDSDN
jgi:hypothetical protein